jgi:hypothetical protein
MERSVDVTQRWVIIVAIDSQVEAALVDSYDVIERSILGIELHLQAKHKRRPRKGRVRVTLG